MYSGRDSVDNCLDPLDCCDMTDKSFCGRVSIPPLTTPPARPLIWSVSAIFKYKNGNFVRYIRKFVDCFKKVLTQKEKGGP